MLNVTLVKIGMIKERREILGSLEKVSIGDTS